MQKGSNTLLVVSTYRDEHKVEVRKLAIWNCRRERSGINDAAVRNRDR